MKEERTTPLRERIIEDMRIRGMAEKTVENPLTEIAREGARRMLASAMEAEIRVVLGQFAEERLPEGRMRVVQHGYGPEREIQTGTGGLEIRRPKVRQPTRPTSTPPRH